VPASYKHVHQYKRNRALLDSELFNDGQCKYQEWVVVIMFYAALHLVDKRVAAVKVHPRNHKDRIKFVNKVLPSHIASKYYTLYMESRKARYDCIEFPYEKVKELKEKCFEVIESNIEV